MTGKVKNFGEKIAMNFIKLKPIYKQLPVIVGVPVIIQNSRGEILLGKRNKKAHSYAGYWGLPGGISSYGEKLIETAKREVFEELEIELKEIKKSKNLYEVLPDKKTILHAINTPFYAKIKSGIPKPKDETSEVKWFNKNEIKKMELAYTHKDILKKEGLLK